MRVRPTLIAFLAATAVAWSLFTPSASAARAAAAVKVPGASAGGMTYDSARHEIVLFVRHGITWTWKNGIWTELHPAVSPSSRGGEGIAFDAAHGEVVMFGGYASDRYFGDTWTWDGATWTRHHPAVSPDPRSDVGMAYDAAMGKVVLYGGYGTHLRRKDTWTWDGTNWTKVHPTRSPGYSSYMGMTYDAATKEVVLFGGETDGETWTWDGTNWTHRETKHLPPPRGTTMVYDAATKNVVLFGGQEENGFYGDTWTWDGADWRERHPATFPSGRIGDGLAYDETSGQVMLRGGYAERGVMADEWLWDGSTWTLQATTRAHVTPKSGAPGTVVEIDASGFGANEGVDITFIDSKLGRIDLGLRGTRRAGGLRTTITIPSNATPGSQTIRLRGLGSGRTVRLAFTVT